MITLILAFVIGGAAGFGVGRIKNAAKLAAIDSAISNYESQIVNGSIGVAVSKILGDIKSKL